MIYQSRPARRAHAGMEPSKTSQTRWKRHNTFTASLHLVPFCWKAVEWTVLSADYIAATNNVTTHSPCTSTHTTHPPLPSPLPSTTLLCTQQITKKVFWKCRDGTLTNQPNKIQRQNTFTGVLSYVVKFYCCRTQQIWIVFYVQLCFVFLLFFGGNDF